MTVIDVRSRFPLAPIWWRGLRSGPEDVTTYALHYIDDEGTVPGPDATQAEELTYLDAIHRYHLAVGYGGFGYHLAAFASGRVYLCTPLNRYGANVLGKNDEVIGVLLVFTGHIVPPLSTREAAVKAVEYSDDTYVGRSPLRPTRGHGELIATTCPGNRWQEWVPNLRESKEEVRRDMALIRHGRAHYLTDGVHINKLSGGTLADAKAAFGDAVEVGQPFIDDIIASERQWVLSKSDVQAAAEAAIRTVLKKGTG